MPQLSLMNEMHIDEHAPTQREKTVGSESARWIGDIAVEVHRVLTCGHKQASEARAMGIQGLDSVDKGKGTVGIFAASPTRDGKPARSPAPAAQTGRATNLTAHR